MRWYLENVEGEYRDYSLDFPDMNRHGGRLRLTLDTNEGTAYMVLVLDDEDGTRFVEADIVSKVPMAWAKAVTDAADAEAKNHA